jgi:propanol-preferring alcohol dehydrogenase
VVIGAGGLGLICISIIKAMKGKGAIVVDIDPVKREVAKRQGALATIDPNAPDALTQLQKAARGPVWAAIDFVGTTQTARLGVDSLVKGGKLIMVGLFGGDITLSLPFFPIRAMTVQGSYTGSLKELNKLIKLVRKAPLPLVPTRTTALDNAQRVISDIKVGKVIGRTVLTPAG